ncbi:MAG: hypothetical protein HZB86_05150 [Deltaproteobacteria bacterium]|nr:hypothetical protein [Deltaproteobacteria bacterium]
MAGFQFVGRPEELRGLVPGVLARFDAARVREALRVPSGFGLAPTVLAGPGTWA